MRMNDKQQMNHERNKDIFQVNFHHFMSSAHDRTAMELAEEYGISLRDVKKLKERLNRS
ncbi:hypothetical protein [Salirhabdus salicampi]|uniref:hypothetical protein n=1 Tax=Salirhabdus salicampi TaxID=476102 RepID=UPI0020C3B036|nr:hypothetical protein [Salirhabdus salicampi]MCP8616974.1 hypothetical protein [Salirhabdus salicampi]